MSKPLSSGLQNRMRDAFFSDGRRLAIDGNGKVGSYDAGDHLISGASQSRVSRRARHPARSMIVTLLIATAMPYGAAGRWNCPSPAPAGARRWLSGRRDTDITSLGNTPEWIVKQCVAA